MSELEIMLNSPMNGKTKEEINSQREEMVNVTIMDDKECDLIIEKAIWHLATHTLSDCIIDSVDIMRGYNETKNIH